MKTTQTDTHEITEYRTPMSSTIPVNRFDAMQFLSFIEADIRVWASMDTDTAKARVTVLTGHYEEACKLFNLPSKLKS